MHKRFFLFAAVFLGAASALASAQTLPDPNLVLEPYHQSGIYKIGERAGWRVHALLGAGYTKFHFELSENNLEVIKSGVIDLSSGEGAIDAILDHPGMLYLRLSYINAPPPSSPPTAQELDKMTAGAAVAPEQIMPPISKPADFGSFWAGKLAALKRVPVNPRLVPAVSDREGIALSTVTLDSLNSQVHGYLAAPNDGAKHPALVIYQYAGVYALQKNSVTDRAAEGWLAFDVDAHDMAPDQATAPLDYAAVGNTSRETSYFLNMYLRDTRALDYIESRPDWDGKTIVLMGMSMGGQQSFATAALNPGRVTAIIVNVPAGADISGDLYGSRRGYPNWPVDDPGGGDRALFRHHELRHGHQGGEPGRVRLHRYDLATLWRSGRVQPDPRPQGSGADAAVRPQPHHATARGRLFHPLARGPGILAGKGPIHAQSEWSRPLAD